MNKKEYGTLKAKFLKLYANVPLPLREEIIAVVDKKPVSWNVSYIEIKADSKNAEIILGSLKKIGVV